MSSRAAVRTLVLWTSDASCVPENVCALQHLGTGDCANMSTFNWLPESSRQLVQTLALAASTTVSSVPAGMAALETEHFQLPHDGRRVAASQQQAAHCGGDGSRMQHRALSLGMGALSAIDIRGCNQLAADCLPAALTRCRTSQVRTPHILLAIYWQF